MWTILCVLATAAFAVSLPIEDWKRHERRVVSKLHQGCFKDGNPRDLPFLVRSSGTENSVTSCIRHCREHGFRFAGLQNAVNCYCGNNAVRQYEEAYDCNKACPADKSYTCGGTNSNDVYYVTSNDLYLGCYNESFTQRDLPFFQWDSSAGKSAEDCMHTCAVSNYRYAGVQQGGACYCGDEFGRHGEADEASCDVRCTGWGKQNCGGSQANAIYKTETVGTLTGTADSFSTRLWDNTGLVSGIPTTLFTLYPALRSILTKRLIIHTASTVLAPIEDQTCADNCYKDCGEVYHDDLSSTASDITLRFFYIKLSQISKYVSSATKRVYVYAQTVVVDQSVALDFSLLIRTKQLFVDRSQAMIINVDSEGLAFDLDIEKERFYDIEPNLMQQKMAFTCAKILQDTNDSFKKGLAYSVVSDIAFTRSKQPEVSSFATSVRGYLSGLAGVARSDVHFVPFYTKRRLSEILETYFDEINIYRKNYDEIRKVRDNTAAFLVYAEAMADTYAATDVAEAKVAFDSAMTAVLRGNETYNRFRWYYDDSRDILDELKVDFEKGLEEHLAWDIARACMKFISGIASIVVGAISFDKDELGESVNPIIDDITGLFDTMYNLADTVRQIDEVSLMADKLIDALEDVDNHDDFLKYLDDLEYTVQLNVNIIKWQNMKNYGTSVLADPEILRIRGAANYHRQLLDVCNWGEALTKAMVERAELLRGAVNSRAIMDAKMSQQKRLKDNIRDTRAGLISGTDVVLADITEQTYDVRMDLNEALVVFCQAYFYENMFECKDSYKPKFGGSLTDLLVKINDASLDNLLVGTTPSSVERELVIKDEKVASTCTDARHCPITNLQDNRMLVFDVPTSHKGLSDLDAYKVAEIKLNFTGVKTKNVKNPWLKVKIESSGQFDGRADGKVHHFLTRPTSVSFEYNVITNHISIYANIDAAFRNIIQHVTPYTTWVMRVSPTRSADIDFSDVKSVRIRFRGSAVDNETFKQRLLQAHPKMA